MYAINFMGCLDVCNTLPKYVHITAFEHKLPQDSRKHLIERFAKHFVLDVRRIRGYASTCRLELQKMIDLMTAHRVPVQVV